MIPRNASAKSPASKSSSWTASSPATRPAVTVMGSTAARVRNSHRLTTSISPDAGGLVVVSTSFQRDSRPWCEVGAVVATRRTLLLGQHLLPTTPGLGHRRRRGIGGLVVDADVERDGGDDGPGPEQQPGLEGERVL